MFLESAAASASLNEDLKETPGPLPRAADTPELPPAPATPQLSGKLRRILLNLDDPDEVRVAVVEDRRLEEYHAERVGERRYLGNIYRGRVVNLEPGIQAAFVDIGIGRNGFLHVSDVLPAYKDAIGIPFERFSERPASGRKLRMQEILLKGQDVLVQIVKDSIGAKGPTLTTYASLPGQYLVLMPGMTRIGISKRIEDEGLRSGLRDLVERLAPPPGIGFIVRTAGLGRSMDDLERDLRHLIGRWGLICSRVGATSSPAVIYEETDIVTRVLRDLLAADLHEILIDDRDAWERARTFLGEALPELASRLRLYESPVPLFTKYGIEEEIEKIYNRKIPLPSGGHLVIQETEALVAIDVNSGRYRDEEDLEATALKTNLEAAAEAARQLRLRDLGGVIAIDFIDMEIEENRREVEAALRKALRRDRAKCWLSRISRFGIVEMTRQRVRPSFERTNHEPCRHCRGRGVVKTARRAGIDILRKLKAALSLQRKEIVGLTVHPEVQQFLTDERCRQMADLEKKFSSVAVIESNAALALDEFQIRYR